MKKIILYLVSLFIILLVLINSGILKINSEVLKKFTVDFSYLNNLFPKKNLAQKLQESKVNIRLLNEESVIVSAVEKVSPSVVTVAVVRPKQLLNPLEMNFFDPFGMGEMMPRRQQKKEQDIGTGFILTKDGLVVTNKHVVSDPDFKYTIVTNDNKKYDVVKIYRDPLNDLAILQVNANSLSPIELGDSQKIKVGQLAIAIGTALGEFRQTVTTGVISGLGRAIVAGDDFGGYQEKLDNLIQTDAAINPGNSGGPLLNSGGQVVGVNVAMSASGQNIGFAIPINTVKEVVENFNNTGKFSRPYLGVRYTQISKQVALLNEVPEGAYIREVVSQSPAEKAEIEAGDIIYKIDGVQLTEEKGGLSGVIAKKKVGERIGLKIYRDGKDMDLSVVLEEAKE